MHLYTIYVNIAKTFGCVLFACEMQKIDSFVYCIILRHSLLFIKTEIAQVQI